MFYHFIGMDLFWWFFWILLFVILMGLFEPTPRRKADRETPLEILQRRFASGELTAEQYQERKKMLESDLVSHAPQQTPVAHGH